nr:MAG TPA: hypothetical protein [Caudoviricetes sp.]
MPIPLQGMAKICNEITGFLRNHEGKRGIKQVFSKLPAN